MVRTGAAPTEAAQRRRRPSSRSAAAADGLVRLLEQEPERDDERRRPRASHRPGRASPPAGPIPSSSVAIGGPPGLFSLAASGRADPDQRQQDAEPGGKCNGKHLADDRAAATTGCRRRPARARRRSSSRRSRRAESPRPRRQRRGVGPTRAAPLPRSRARCGARSSPTFDDTRPSRAPPPAEERSAQRERPAGERRNDLRRHPDRRRPVANRVAVAAVGPPEPAQVPERRLAGLLARADERLDRPGRRLRIRLAPLRERKPAVAVLEGAQRDERAADRRAADTRCPQRLDRGGGVVRVGSAALRPREASSLAPARRGSPARDSAARARRRRGARCTVQIVSLTSTSGRWRRSRARTLSSIVSPRAARATTRNARSASLGTSVMRARRNSAACARSAWFPPAATRPSAAQAVSGASGARPCSAKPPLALCRPARNAADPAAGPVAAAAVPASTIVSRPIASHLMPTPPRCGRFAHGDRAPVAAPARRRGQGRGSRAHARC